MVMKIPLKGCLLSALVLATLLLCTGCDEKKGVKIGDNPPAISDNDIHGEFVSLAQLKGKIVIVYFWTNSCCGDSLKELEPIYSRNKYKGLEILAINEMDSRKDVESYALNNRLTFTMLTDEHSMLFKQYKVLGFPTVFILDRSGIVREKILGDVQIAKLEKLVLRQFDIQKKAEESYEKVHAR
jgi:peroxiredoxin